MVKESESSSKSKTFATLARAFQKDKLKFHADDF